MERTICGKPRQSLRGKAQVVLEIMLLQLVPQRIAPNFQDTRSLRLIPAGRLHGALDQQPLLIL